MKTVVVTGATGDLGSVVVARLLREYRCAAVYRSRDAWQKLESDVKAGDRLIGIPEVPQIRNHAPIYALVLLAGGFGAGASSDDFRRMFDTNVLSNVRVIEAALPHIDNGGRVVAISSAASLANPPGLAAYSASKAALNAIIQTLAKELEERDITANALLPTALDTPSQQKTMPADRLVKRENVAEMIALLLAPQAANITGQLIGMSA